MLSITAMLDGKLPPSRPNLERVSASLADIHAVVVTVRNGDWDHSNSAHKLFELREVAESVVRDLALTASAAEANLVLAAEPEPPGCLALRGAPEEAYRALDRVLRHLLTATPKITQIELSTPSAQLVRLTIGGDSPAVLEALPQSAALMESYGGSAHRDAAGNLCLHFEAAPICRCAALPPCNGGM